MGRSRSQANVATGISHPKSYNTILAPLPFGSPIHAPTKMKHLTTHTAPPCCFCLFYLQQLADVFYIKSPEPNCQRDSSVFLKALAFITCNRAGKSAHGKIPSWSTRSRQRSSTRCILQGHPVERQKFGRLEIWVAEPRNC